MVYIVGGGTNLASNSRCDVVRRLFDAQIENSVYFGWVPSDIIIVTNIDYENQDATILQKDFTPPSTASLLLSKHYASLQIAEGKWGVGDNADGVIWFHDLDAWQMAHFDVPDFKSVGVCFGGNECFNTGSFFFRQSAVLLFRELMQFVECSKTRHVNDEWYFNHLFLGPDSNWKDDITKLNYTFNVGSLNMKKRYDLADKPIKVLHMHLENPNMWFSLYKISSQLKLEEHYVQERLWNILCKHFPEREIVRDAPLESLVSSVDFMTSFNTRIFECPGQLICGSFKEVYPGATLHTYHENSYDSTRLKQSIDLKKLPAECVPHDVFEEQDWLLEFLNNSPLSTWKERHDYWNRNAVFWFRKVAAMEACLRETTASFLIWLDADCCVLKPFPAAWWDYIQSKDVCCILRDEKTIDSGVLVFNLERKGAQVIRNLIEWYRDGRAFQEKRWDDAFILTKMLAESDFEVGGLTQEFGNPVDVYKYVRHLKKPLNQVRDKEEPVSKPEESMGVLYGDYSLTVPEAKDTVEIVFPKSSERYVKLQCNGIKSFYTAMPGFSLIKPFLTSLNPAVCLDLGCGLGRASVFLKKALKWGDGGLPHFYFLDGDEGDRQIAGIRWNRTGDYYNSKDATLEFCSANNLGSFEFVEQLSQIRLSVDLCYSFLSIGWHWSIELYLDSLAEHLAPECRLVFQIRNNNAGSGFRKFSEYQIEYANRHPLYSVDAVVWGKTKNEGSWLFLRHVPRNDLDREEKATC